MPGVLVWMARAILSDVITDRVPACAISFRVFPALSASLSPSSSSSLFPFPPHFSFSPLLLASASPPGLVLAATWPPLGLASRPWTIPTGLPAQRLVQVPGSRQPPPAAPLRVCFYPPTGAYPHVVAVSSCCAPPATGRDGEPCYFAAEARTKTLLSEPSRPVFGLFGLFGLFWSPGWSCLDVWLSLARMPPFWPSGTRHAYRHAPAPPRHGREPPADTWASMSSGVSTGYVDSAIAFCAPRILFYWLPPRSASSPSRSDIRQLVERRRACMSRPPLLPCLLLACLDRLDCP